MLLFILDHMADIFAWFFIGLLLGSGALIGDAVKSFFKRKEGIKPGNRFIPWDQLDYSIGSLVLLIEQLFISRERISDIGKVDLICLDKTGTLTEEELKRIR